MNADLRALREQDLMEREAVQERMHAFWEPQDRKEAESFLAADVADDPELSSLLFDLCSNDIDDHEKIFQAAKRLLMAAQGVIYQYAINDSLPLTIITNEPEDARAMARGTI